MITQINVCLLSIFYFFQRKFNYAKELATSFNRMENNLGGNPGGTTVLVGAILDNGTEDQRHNGGELDQDVEGGTRGILEGVTDGVTGDGVQIGRAHV